jgi:hypothetical protein
MEFEKEKTQPVGGWGFKMIIGALIITLGAV